MLHADWDKIKAEYLRGGTSQRKLADKYGIPLSTLRRRAEKETWTQQREKVARKAGAKVVQKIVSQRAKDMEALDRSRSRLIEKLANAIEKYPDMPGNRMEQTVTELIGVEGAKKQPRQKTVRVESDLLKMVSALEKLMEMSGYDAAGQNRDAPVLLDRRPDE